MDGSYTVNLNTQRIAKRIREDRDTILSTFGIANTEVAIVEINILETKTEPLSQPQAATIQKGCDLPVWIPHVREDSMHFIRSQDHLNPHSLLATNNPLQPAKILLENMSVEKDQGAKRLILRRRRHPLLNCKVREIGPDVFTVQNFRVASAMKTDISPDPMYIGLLGPVAIVSNPNGFTQPG